MKAEMQSQYANPAPSITWYRPDETVAPPPYDQWSDPLLARCPAFMVVDREDTGVHPRILAAGYRQDVWRLLDYAAQALSFREERLLIDLTFDRLQDVYDQYQVLDQLAANRRLTQLGRGYLGNCLPRLHDPDYRQRVAEVLRWNYMH